MLILSRTGPYESRIVASDSLNASLICCSSAFMGSWVLPSCYLAYQLAILNASELSRLIHERHVNVIAGVSKHLNVWGGQGHIVVFREVAGKVRKDHEQDEGDAFV